MAEHPSDNGSKVGASNGQTTVEMCTGNGDNEQLRDRFTRNPLVMLAIMFKVCIEYIRNLSTLDICVRRLS
jgi:hypothetical protein